MKQSSQFQFQTRCNVRKSIALATLLLLAALVLSWAAHCQSCKHHCVTYGSGTYLRISDGQLESSENKATWTNRPLPIPTFVRGMTYANGLFVAVGGSYVENPGVILTSVDGITWTRRKSQNKINLNGVAYGNGFFVAVGDAGTILTSSNGVGWCTRCSGTSATLACVAFGNGIFVVGGESGTILVSTNGLQWTSQSVEDSLYVGQILFRDGLFQVTASGSVLTSADGRLWLRPAAQTVRNP